MDHTTTTETPFQILSTPTNSTTSTSSFKTAIMEDAADPQVPDHHADSDDHDHAAVNTSLDALNPCSEQEADGIMLEETPSVSPSSASPISLAWYQNPHQITAMVSNFSTSYNVVNISLVLPILEQIYPTHNSEDAAASASSLLAGMIVGQVVGGALGDTPWLGRLGALLLVMSLQIVASLGSALLFWWKDSNNYHETDGADIYLWLSVWRFVLGIGAGGVYPLAAVLSAEQGGGQSSTNNHNNDSNSGSHSSNSDEDSSSQVHRVVLTFSTQGLGFVMVPIVAVSLLHTTENLDLIWRCMLGLGSVPGIILFLLQLRLHYCNKPSPTRHGLQLVPSSDEDDEDHANLTILPSLPQAVAATTATGASNPMDDSLEEPHESQLDFSATTAPTSNDNNSSCWDSIRHEPNLGQKLLGTAGAWFLFDVLFYGNTIFQPIVVEAAFGGSKSESPLRLLQQTAMDSLILTSIALPGYAVAGIAMGGDKESRNCFTTQSPRYVMLQGFAAMGFLYLCIGWNWSYLRHYPVILVCLYGMTFFFANYGPNTTTFILPSLLYSPECRSTLNGISAACGKLGALVGATLFEPAATQFGDKYVMIVCSTVSFVAMTLTYCCVPTSSRSPSSSSSSSPPHPRHSHLT